MSANSADSKLSEIVDLRVGLLVHLVSGNTSNTLEWVIFSFNEINLVWK